MRKRLKPLVTAFCILVLSPHLLAQGTAFTYQGRLEAGGNAASGSYDMQFNLYSAATNGIALGSLTNGATAVNNGLFLVQLDFGGVFNGANYWLEIAVRPQGSGGFTPLSPRQLITPAPQALYSANAGNAASALTAVRAGSADAVLAANIAGTLQLAQLPGNLITNNQGGVSLSGAFTGNGAGLTNLPTANPVGPATDTQFWISNVTAAAGNQAFPGLIHKLAWTNAVTNLQCEVLRDAWIYSPTAPTPEGGLSPVQQQSANNTMPFYINFGFSGPYFIFGTYGHYYPIVVAVNGVDSPTPIAAYAGNGAAYYRVQFLTSAYRQITLKLANANPSTSPFLGVWIEPHSGWGNGSPGRKYRMIYLGSSYVEEPGTSSGLYTQYPASYGRQWPNTGTGADLMYLFNNLDVWASGSGGTGINANNGSRTNYPGRVLSDVTPYKPDYALIDAGANDWGSSSNAVYTNAERLFKAIQTNSPATRIIVATSPYFGSPPAYSVTDPTWATFLAITNAMNNNGVTNLVDTFTDPAFPTGYDPQFISAAHPTAPGCWVYARAIADKLTTICPELIPSGYALPGIPLNVPTGLTALAGYGVITLSWQTPLAGAVSYNVKRGRTSGAETLLTNVTSTSFADLEVVGGSPYYYVVSALAADGTESPNSYETSATPLIYVPPLLSLSMTPVRWLAASTNVFADDEGTIPATPGGPVALWRDSSGNGRDLKCAAVPLDELATSWLGDGSAVASRPAGSLVFTNATAEPMISAPVTCVWIGQCTTDTSGGRAYLFSTGDAHNNNACYLYERLQNYGFGTAGDLANLNSPASTNAVWCLATFDGAQSALYVNGTNATNRDLAPAGALGLTLGSDAGRQFPMAGYVAEFAQYAGSPNPNDLLVISNYVSTRYHIHN